MEVVQLRVARIETPQGVIEKAKAKLAPGQLTVYDRRSGQVILDVQHDRVEQFGGVWAYGDVTVTRMTGCGCGGTVDRRVK